MNPEQKVKQEVRERYTQALVTGDGCCGSSAEIQKCGCCGPDSAESFFPSDRVVLRAGYTADELVRLPREATANSFGCGNPLAFTGVQPGQTILDIGSGAGIDCLIAARKVGPRGKVIGIDMTPAMITKAQENGSKAGMSNVEFRIGEAENMPVEAGTVDWIISNCVINLSPNKPAVFREAFRVLKSGGHFSISDIMVEKLPWFFRRSSSLYTSCVAGAIPETRYLDGLRQAGFVDLEVTERIVYDSNQILHLIGNTILPKSLMGWLAPITAMISRRLEGNIWSAKVQGRKP
jgi:arsenite methyltransferase